MRAPSLKAPDFQKALGSRPVSRTAHFTLHILRAQPSQVEGAARSAVDAPKLSTRHDCTEMVLVDDSSAARVPARRFGLVLPKKQARRAVTRSLIRHQARAALQRHLVTWSAEALSQAKVDGWVLRLKAPFDRQVFPSAASEALRCAVRQELDELWSRVVLPASGEPRSRPLPPEPAAIRPQGGA